MSSTESAGADDGVVLGEREKNPRLVPIHPASKEIPAAHIQTLRTLTTPDAIIAAPVLIKHALTTSVKKCDKTSIKKLGIVIGKNPVLCVCLNKAAIFISVGLIAL